MDDDKYFFNNGEREDRDSDEQEARDSQAIESGIQPDEPELPQAETYNRFAEPELPQTETYDRFAEPERSPVLSDVRPADDAYGFTPAPFIREYNDAGYTPRSEAPILPQTPRYTAPPRKKKSGGGAVKYICACLVCAVLGGAAGGALTGGYIYHYTNNQTDQDANFAPGSTATDIPAPTSTPAIRPVVTSDGTALTGTEIYELGSVSAVGVTTEATTTNRIGQTSKSAVSGSGFIIREDGYILTNYHVVESAYLGGYEVKVFLYDETSYTAQIINVEPSNDLAILKIDANGLPAVTIGDSDAMQVGEPVYAIGNPLGELTFTMTGGAVSALDREISTESNGGTINMFQFDAAVNSGNSGGPVFNQYGEVIGVVTAKYSATGVEGLGFAIPINDAMLAADRIIEKGAVSGKAAYLGVSNLYTINASEALYYNVAEGVMVGQVSPGSCAEKAGLLPKDILTSLGGIKIPSVTGLQAALRTWREGDTTTITVFRSGGLLELTVVFDAVPEQSAG
jgi:serine protease Do